MPMLRVAFFWAGYIALLLLASLAKGMAPPSLAQLVWGATSAFAILLMTVWFARRDGQSLDTIGARPSLPGMGRVALGALIGLTMYGVHIAAVSTLGGSLGFTRNPGSPLAAIFLAVVTFVALSAMEELGFRGYPLRTLTTARGPTQALIITSIAFGLSHLLYGWSWGSVVLGVVPGALVFGAAALASGGLGVPIGLHAAWNLASWSTGEKGDPGVWAPHVAAEVLGRVERVGAVSYLATMLLTAGLLWWWYRRRGNHLR